MLMFIFIYILSICVYRFLSICKGLVRTTFFMWHPNLPLEQLQVAGCTSSMRWWFVSCPSAAGQWQHFSTPPQPPKKEHKIPTGLLAVNGSCHHFFWPGFSIWGQGAALRKIKKKMIHQELISEVLMTLRFPAEAADIKRRIESLIEREWLVGRIPCRKCLRSVAVISEKGDMEHPAGMDQFVTELAWTGFTLYTFFFSRERLSAGFFQ